MKIKEAAITINGTELTFGQAMTLRVAITSFLTDMQTNGLGDDAMGKSIAKGYAERSKEIIEIILKNQ